MTDEQTGSDDPIKIKKYANRRLYNTATSAYVTLDDLAEMVKQGTDFVVHDAKSGEDITHSVLTQIIFEQETKGQNMLPISFLRQLIRFYGDSMQALVPSYLEFSVARLAKEQGRLREQMTEAFGTPFELMEDQVRKNMNTFSEAMSVFLPFSAGNSSPATQDGEGASDEISELKKQLAAMQAQLNKISERGK